MTLKDALETKMPIRNPDMGFQFLIPDESPYGETIYKLSGTTLPAYMFNQSDRVRQDWSTIDSTEPTPPAEVPLNPDLEEKFPEDEVPAEPVSHEPAAPKKKGGFFGLGQKD